MSNASTEQPVRRLPDFGAWVIKCNPEFSKPQELLAKGGLDDYWSLTNSTSYRLDEMREDDPVIFYVGRGSRTVDAGFWGAGVITDGVVTGIQADPDAWADSERAQSRTTWLGVGLTFWEVPVTLEQSREDEVLAASEPVAKPQVSPAYLTKSELDSLLALAGHESLYDGTAAVRSRHSGSGLKAIVEKRAVAAAKKHYRKLGFKVVDDVQSERGLGYDLKLKRKEGGVKETILVEVKGKIGRRTASSAVILSANELKAAKKEKDWRLVVVSEALEKKPVVTEFSGKEARKAAKAMSHTVTLPSP
ncbi:DUF3883 domain-containing protein [Flavimobilis sp. GY10621]|uniref:DUF3883 domain-containing protein n=1 Tax=Flavimobilis rhizosphaerae TaxID=2775421 RepID=A0ABR9DQA9_9MICO|nr:DUF3883 domain-containing protein [Flavimobilis rhizosphaerae]MBD9699306.1 DUF3883 domain-containing protein [Flavimobilis rhizosphaerae]